MSMGFPNQLRQSGDLPRSTKRRAEQLGGTRCWKFAAVCFLTSIATFYSASVSAQKGTTHSGIEHASAVGSNEAHTCSIAMSKAQASASTMAAQLNRPMRFTMSISEKKCECTENRNLPLSQWSCIALMAWSTKQ
jgi:hypothetical protein